MGLGALRRVAALRQNEPENRTRSVVRYGPFAGRAPRSPQRRPAEKPRSGPPAGALSWAWPKVPCFWTAAVPCYRCFRRQLGAHRMATAREHRQVPGLTTILLPIHPRTAAFTGYTAILWYDARSGGDGTREGPVPACGCVAL